MEDNVVLDDLRKIHERDKDDVLGFIASEWQQLAVNLTGMPKVSFSNITNIVYSDIDETAIAALILSALSTLTVPLELVGRSVLPTFVNNQTLYIISGSSGDEGVLEAIERASRSGAQIAIITDFGNLAELAKERNYPFFMLPKSRQSRFTVFAKLRALTQLLAPSHMCSLDSEKLSSAAEFLKNEATNWLPTISTQDNRAKQIAQELMGKSVVVYAPTSLKPAAYEWKVKLNTTAKQIAWLGLSEDFGFGEFLGWSGQPERKPYAIVELRTNLADQDIQERLTVERRMLSGARPVPLDIMVKGQSQLEQLLWAMLLGDFVSAYLALLNGFDPGSLAILEKFKHDLKEHLPDALQST